MLLNLKIITERKGDGLLNLACGDVIGHLSYAHVVYGNISALD